MTKEYSLRKRNNGSLIKLLIVSLILLLASLALFINISKKPKIQLTQVDLSLRNSTKLLAKSFTIAILDGNVLDTKVISQDIKENDRYFVILNSLKENMSWPETVRVDSVIGLEHKQKKYAIVNLAIDRNIPIEISIKQERNILNSIGQTLKLNGADDFRILINDKESKLFIKNISLKTGLD